MKSNLLVVFSVSLLFMSACSSSKEPAEESVSDATSRTIVTPIYTIQLVDEPAVPVDGLDAIQRRINYPAEARINQIEGVVLVSFWITADGKVVNAEVKEGVHPLLNNEALRVVRAQEFRPAIKDGEPVWMSRELPVTFSLK